MFVVNGIEWNLSFAEPYSAMLMRSDNVYTLGVTDNNTKTIYINNRLTGVMFDKVLCHELCHVASFSYNLHIDIQTEEIIADFLSTYGREIFDIADDLLRRFMRIA